MGSLQQRKGWHRAKERAVFLYRISVEEVFAENRRLRDQIRRAAIPVPGAIAGKDEPDTDRHAMQSSHTAKGAPAEGLAQEVIAQKINNTAKEPSDHIRHARDAFSRWLGRGSFRPDRQTPVIKSGEERFPRALCL